jgi:hypothetical protein
MQMIARCQTTSSASCESTQPSRGLTLLAKPSAPGGSPEKARSAKRCTSGAALLKPQASNS